MDISSKRVLIFLRELKNRDIKVAVDGDMLRIEAPRGALSSVIKELLTELKPQIIELLSPPWVIDYPPAALRGAMPVVYNLLDDGKIRAHYRTADELREHLKAVSTPQLVELAEELGGTVL